MKILIVEDDKNLASVLQNMFAGHKTIVVSELKAAMTVVENEKPDLVILDCMLDDTCHPNDTVCGIPKMIEKSPNTAILLYTGYGSDEVKNQAIAGGAVGLIKKGSVWKLSELASQIKAILHGSKFPHLVEKLEDVLNVKL